MLTIVKSGRDLTDKELGIVNKYRKIEFNSKNSIDPQLGNEDWENNYFLVKDDQESVLAFGVIRVTEIEFRRKIYPVLEFISVVSIVKRRGYGSLVMEEMKKYSSKEGKTLIGFCISDLVPFYLKTGFETTMGSKDRFCFKKDKWSFPGETPGEAVYVRGRDCLIDGMLQHPQEEIYVTRHKS